MPQYAHLKLVISGGSHTARALRRMKNGSHASTCALHSLRYCYYLATAEYLVCDVTFPPYFSRREDQKYLNTWHGTPLKSLGRRIASSPIGLVSNTQRNFLHATHLLAPNEHTEKVLLQDYMIEKIWNGVVLRGGYPRNDVFVNVPQRSQHSPENNCYNIAFMPTWRGTLKNLKESTELQLQELQQLFSHLEQHLPENTVWWVKLHPLIHEKLGLSKFSRIRGFPSGMETYEFLAQCDALVTDYSSVMFDFAVTRKPIVMYIPDETEYRAGRNFCLDLSELPFPQVRSEEELKRLLATLSQQDFIPPASYIKFVARFCPHDQGQNTAALCAHFFGNEKMLVEYIVQPDRSKKNVLLFVGSFLNNGITTSLKSLLQHIDKDRYNLYLWIDRHQGEARAEEYFYALDHHIGFIPTQNWLAVDAIDAVRFLWRDLFSRDYDETDTFKNTLWKRDYRRQFCNVEWDAIVHFTGYERRIAFLMMAARAKKIVFMHSDIFLEEKNKRLYDTRAVRLAYKIADEIATVRHGLDAAYSTHVLDISSKTRFVPNTISLKCREMAKAEVCESLHQAMRECCGELQEALKKPGQFRFINLARFSPEKGQFRLIEAFERVWQRQPNCQLFIMGAHGPLYEAVLERAQNSPAASSIFVLLGSNNPFPLLARSDAFVFSSFYEGIGLVLYESFALGIPVISTDIPGPSELLSEGYGLVVDNSVDGLAEGMNAALEGKVPMRPYDFEKHNRESLESFYALLD
jgi:CDP-glycerol glycerophosphotransferase